MEVVNHVHNRTEWNNSNSSLNQNCNQWPTLYIETQFYLVVVCGTFIATFSILGNLLILFLFVGRRYFWQKHYYYLMTLCLFDIIQSAGYIAVLSVCVLYEFTENLFLMRAWYQYVIIGTLAWNIARATGAYLLVAASTERYLSAHWLSDVCTNRSRFVAIICAILCAVLVTGSQAWEVQVRHRPNCSGLAEFILEESEMLARRSYRVWVFLIRNICTIFGPFLLLILLNGGIVLKTQDCIRVRIGERLYSKFTKNANSFPAQDKVVLPKQSMRVLQRMGWVARARVRVKRAATRTLLVMVFAYLLSSGLAVFLTAWEYIDYASLSAQFEFYTYASDLTSIFSILVCASRLPTYLVCDIKFRHIFLVLFCRRLRKSYSDQQLAVIPRVRDPKSATWKPRNFGSVVLATMRKNSLGLWAFYQGSNRSSKRTPEKKADKPQESMQTFAKPEDIAEDWDESIETETHFCSPESFEKTDITVPVVFHNSLH